jgi:hypothetical protein
MYASAFRPAYQFPAKYGWFVAGWAFLATRFNTPQPGAFVCVMRAPRVEQGPEPLLL